VAPGTLSGHVYRQGTTTGVANAQVQIYSSTASGFGSHVSIWDKPPCSRMTRTRFAFGVISSLYVLIAIPFEERSLRADTQGAYNRYATLVKWKLVPGIY